MDGRFEVSPALGSPLMRSGTQRGLMDFRIPPRSRIREELEQQLARPRAVTPNRAHDIPYAEHPSRQGPDNDATWKDQDRRHPDSVSAEVMTPPPITERLPALQPSRRSSPQRGRWIYQDDNAIEIQIPWHSQPSRRPIPDPVPPPDHPAAGRPTQTGPVTPQPGWLTARIKVIQLQRWRV